MNATAAPAKTVHTCGGPTFGRLTSGCPRCDELAAGAEPVRWAGTRNRYADTTPGPCPRCAAGTCTPICTWGDW